MKLGIVGSRRRAEAKDCQLLVKRVKELQPDMIISGGCSSGADHFAELIARNLGIPITIYYPKLDNTKRYPYHEIVKANYARNELIAKESDKLLTLVAPDRKGGTENTIDWFRAWHQHDDNWEEGLEIL